MKTAEEILKPFIETPFRHAKIVDADNALIAIKLFADQFKNIIALEKERMEWSRKTFPEATPLSSLEKLHDEIEEVAHEIHHGHENLTEEYADCLMCLFDSAGRMDISPEQIFEAFAKKLEINKNRVWKKNDNNTYSHVKPTT